MYAPADEASLGLAINWYGDSLDDMLARVRNAQSPICGFAKFCEVF